MLLKAHCLFQSDRRTIQNVEQGQETPPWPTDCFNSDTGWNSRFLFLGGVSWTPGEGDTESFCHGLASTRSSVSSCLNLD